MTIFVWIPRSRSLALSVRLVWRSYRPPPALGRATDAVQSQAPRRFEPRSRRRVSRSARADKKQCGEFWHHRRGRQGSSTNRSRRSMSTASRGDGSHGVQSPATVRVKSGPSACFIEPRRVLRHRLGRPREFHQGARLSATGSLLCSHSAWSGASSTTSRAFRPVRSPRDTFAYLRAMGVGRSPRFIGHLRAGAR